MDLLHLHIKIIISKSPIYSCILQKWKIPYSCLFLVDYLFPGIVNCKFPLILCYSSVFYHISFPPQQFLLKTQAITFSVTGRRKRTCLRCTFFHVFFKLHSYVIYYISRLCCLPSHVYTVWFYIPLIISYQSPLHIAIQ